MQYSAARTAIHIASVFAIYLSVAMLVPAMVDLYYGNDDWRVFAFSAFFTGGLSLAVAMATQGRAPVISSRFGFLVVNLLWFTACVVGAIPLFASSVDIDLVDSFFESVSAATATGATVLVGLDGMPPGLLLWRSILQWIGGLGVIALGLFVLPFLNVGGVSYFKIESSDIADKPFDRFSTFATGLVSIYVLLTFVCGVAYAAAGMPTFDAVNHAMTTLATAGFSTHDASMGAYADNPAILWVGTIFMFIGALPFSILILFSVRGRLDALRDPQIRVFAGYTLVFVLAVAVYLRITGDRSFVDALTHAAFNFVSIITTTGYATEDYGAWGAFALTAAFVAMFLGGCSGSTTGGIKAYRFLILFELLANGLRRLVYPNTVLSVRYGDRPVEDELQRAVVLYISAFFVIWAFVILLLGATGLDLVSAVSTALSALTNVGPGLGPVVGPAGNFASLTDPAKLIMALAMLLGRLEILAVLVIFTPIFWGR
ncbi:TrkH family potassium uptake protein [Chelativorans sp. M5D2P16]|uniref:TrkH family potassium uptake protein n=1 Tax=Chelativorans sp. M5D2P16 TaxID=3095678 RepID=UPI002ACAEDE7|nr:TrkH family potassium uptake protein [Chelativorans sp. M5D2P16]MDZ5696341.1 TrkH family potassium uptake protein [Chelativorans sp. M5D2P16]